MVPFFSSRQVFRTLVSIVGLSSALCLSGNNLGIAALPPQGSPKNSTVLHLAKANTQISDVLLAVAIERSVPALSLATSTPGQITDDAGRVLRGVSTSQPLIVQTSNGTIAIAKSSFVMPNSFWVTASSGGYVWVGNRWYRGRVRVILQGDGLLAVNHVHLEQYLFSVVGSEMPASWPLEALKAQAVAARSYALVHYLRPASPFFHLGNTQRWQVYKGVDSESSRTYEAVRLTSGQVLSHRGGVVESLYAATDEIVSDAHGGQGMSQYGARDLAAKGYSYRHILGNYYPGVSLAQIRLRDR